MTAMRRALILGSIVLFACSTEAPPRTPLTGTSPLVAIMHEASAEEDVPAELLAGIAWSETALNDHSKHWSVSSDGHGPRSAGVMGLPEHGAVRSVDRAAALLGEKPETIVFDARSNVRGAAAILRAIADEMFGVGALNASSSRDDWLRVVEKYFDAGATGEKLALEVRKTIARGLSTRDENGNTFYIPSFSQLYSGSGVERQRFNVGGEYPSSTWVAASSSNYTNDSRTAADIDIVVIHTTQGSYAGTISWFQNSAAQVSAHYVVRASDGDITQMVHHADIAWHAGNWSYNTRSIGIEHEGFVDDPNTYTMAQYQASADLTRWLCDNLGVPKDRNHIIGHVEVPTATHTDPGQYWDWTLYMDLVNQTGTMPPPAGTGTLKGVVYIGQDTTNRVSGAAVTVNPGNVRATADMSGYFEFALAPGDYTVEATSPGYTTGSRMRTVTAGQEIWGSVSIGANPTSRGVYRGSVYDARQPDFSVRLGGSTVTLSNGDRVVTNDQGEFIFNVAPGQYTATAELNGWESNFTQRTVVADATIWGSIGLVPAGSTMNQPPRVPQPESPINRVTTASAQPIFTVSGVEDPDGDPLSLEVEIYAEETLETRVSTVKVSVPAGSTVVSWRHPVNDLPVGFDLYWRTRALDGYSASPWCAPQAFNVYDETGMYAPSTEVNNADALPGVGVNTAPSAPEIRDPLENAIVQTTRPQILIAAATDPEGLPLSYQVQIAADDVFEVVEQQSELLPSQGDVTGWVVGEGLALGANYYVRARAADERVFGDWSQVIAFSVDPNAATDGGNGIGGDRGGPPEIGVKVVDDAGCTAAGKPGAGALLLLVGFGVAMIRRRPRSRDEASRSTVSARVARL